VVILITGRLDGMGLKRDLEYRGNVYRRFLLGVLNMHYLLRRS